MMAYLRAPFVAGAILHVILIFTRINIGSLSCVGNDCSGLIWADMPLSIIYFAFPDAGLIIASLVVGTVLWGVWGLLIQRILRFLFRE